MASVFSHRPSGDIDNFLITPQCNSIGNDRVQDTIVPSPHRFRVGVIKPMRQDSITYCDVSFVRFANATRMKSLSFSQAYDSSRSCWRVSSFEGASSGGSSLTAIQDDRSLSRAFSPTIVFCSSDTACLYTILNFRGPGKQQCP